MPVPQIGEDVTSLMPEIGEDVTALMDAAPEQEERTWTDTAVDALPLIGGSIGGMVGVVGGPVGIGAGAALGGAGGEGWRRVIQGLRGRRNLAQDTPAGAARDIALTGAGQAATELAGGLAAKGLVKGGARMYRGLLKPSKAIQGSFGGDDVVRTLIDEGVTISDRGLDKATGLLGSSRAKALDLVREAAPTSTFVAPKEIADEFLPVIETLKRRAAIGQANELGRVAERTKRLTKTLEGGVDAAGAQTMKETAQDAASGAYRMMERGGAKQLGADDLLDEATARGFRKAVENRVPGVAAQNKTTQRLMGGTRAVEDALERGRNNLSVGGARDLIAAGVGGSIAGPAGLTAGLLTRLLASPRSGSAAAIGLDRVGKKVPIDDLIRAVTLLAQEQER